MVLRPTFSRKSSECFPPVKPGCCLRWARPQASTQQPHLGPRDTWPETRQPEGETRLEDIFSQHPVEKQHICTALTPPCLWLCINDRHGPAKWSCPWSSDSSVAPPLLGTAQPLGRASGEKCIHERAKATVRSEGGKCGKQPWKHWEESKKRKGIRWSPCSLWSRSPMPELRGISCSCDLFKLIVIKLSFLRDGKQLKDYSWWLSKPKCHENELFSTVTIKNEVHFGCEICLMSTVKKNGVLI